MRLIMSIGAFGSHSHENKAPMSSLRNTLDDANSRLRNFLIVALTLPSAPVILMAFNDESMFFVAWIRFSVAASHSFCWDDACAPMKAEAKVHTVKTE